MHHFSFGCHNMAGTTARKPCSVNSKRSVRWKRERNEGNRRAEGGESWRGEGRTQEGVVGWPGGVGCGRGVRWERVIAWELKRERLKEWHGGPSGLARVTQTFNYRAPNKLSPPDVGSFPHTSFDRPVPTDYRLPEVVRAWAFLLTHARPWNCLCLLTHSLPPSL